MYETEVDMQLPAFKIETKTDLKEILINVSNSNFKSSSSSLISISQQIILYWLIE